MINFVFLFLSYFSYRVQIDYIEYKKFVNNDRAGSICAAFFLVNLTTGCASGHHRALAMGIDKKSPPLL